MTLGEVSDCATKTRSSDPIFANGTRFTQEVQPQFLRLRLTSITARRHRPNKRHQLCHHGLIRHVCQLFGSVVFRKVAQLDGQGGGLEHGAQGKTRLHL